jgi:hypothetical protein
VQVMWQEKVCIALTIDHELKTCNMKNTYLSAPCKENICTRRGDELGPDYGKLAIVTRAIYGLNNAGSSFDRHFSDRIRQLDCETYLADTDLWLKQMEQPDDGLEYY